MGVLRRWIAAVVLSLAAAVPAAQGAALWLYEMGAPDMGAAGAGQAAKAADASTAFLNPAGMTRLDRSQVLLGIQPTYLDIQFDTQDSAFGGGDGGNAGGFVPVGSLHYVHSLTPDFKLGVSAASYFGLGVDYGDDWAGRYYVTEAEFLTFGITPSAAYRINHWLSVGAGVNILFAQLNQKAAINNAVVPGQEGSSDGKIKIEDDDMGYGFNLGILLEPRKGTRIGIAYRSKVDVEFDDVAKLKRVGPVLQGQLDASGLAGSKADIDMTVPQGVMVSAYHQITDRWAIMGNIGWQEWSEFGHSDITIESSDSKKFTQDLGYDDTWHVALGAQCRIAEPWLWSFGAAYDTSPIDGSKDRTPALPFDRQIRLATGIQYDWSEDVTIGCAYEYLDLGDADINQEGGPLKGPLKGDYSPNAAHNFAVNLNWKF
ncbi:MAG: outer membrane protein transport protein [Desulfobacterales bacterium]|jgi:long-chain fatty acid transport protein